MTYDQFASFAGTTAHPEKRSVKFESVKLLAACRGYRVMGPDVNLVIETHSGARM